MYLFVSKSCPYAHRCEIAKELFNRTDITTIYCDPVFTFNNGWTIDKENNPTIFNTIKEIYIATEFNDTKYYSLPVLYDGNLNKIISNESLEIIKLMNPINPEVTVINNEFYTKFDEHIVRGTYKAGHAKTLEEYEMFCNNVFNYLIEFNEYMKDRIYIEKTLSFDHDTFIEINRLTINDIIAYCHLVRFDTVFYRLFAVNRKHLWEYENIMRYMKALSGIDAFKNNTDIEQIKYGAYNTENNLPQNLGIDKTMLGDCGAEKYL